MEAAIDDVASLCLDELIATLSDAWESDLEALETCSTLFKTSLRDVCTLEARLLNAVAVCPISSLLLILDLQVKSLSVSMDFIVSLKVLRGIVTDLMIIIDSTRIKITAMAIVI
jgi:hypothetical protein